MFVTFKILISTIFIVYYLHHTMMNWHGMNCYCWDFIIIIFNFIYSNMRTLKFLVPLGFVMGASTPMLLCSLFVETWWNVDLFGNNFYQLRNVPWL